MSNFFTSDLHFGHANIIRFSGRPFATAAEMDETLINNWNCIVDEFDHIYIIGDVSFHNAARTREILASLNGIKYLVYGNHDQVIRNNKNLREFFAETHELLERDFLLNDEKIKIVMCHYAMRVWNKSHYGSLHLYGHSHGGMPDDGTRSMDVGVDVNGMYPVSLEEIVEKIGSRRIGFSKENM
jgi:calcineurin-like phosphoesterase family protein